MKKVLTIGLMLLACAGFVFAEEDTLTVKLEVKETNDAEWFIDSAPTSITDFDSRSASEVDEVSLSSEKKSIKAYPAVKTNSSSAVDMYIYGNPLKSDTTGDYIVIKLSGGTDESYKENTWTETDVNSNEKYIKFLESEDANTKSQRIFSGTLTIEYVQDSFDAAGAADDYTANLTLVLEAKA